MYAVSVTINWQICNVTEAACSCPVGRGPLGSCKHKAALYFVLKALSKHQQNSAKDVRTYLWIWDKKHDCTVASQK